MVEIAYSLMVFLVILFVVQELCWSKLPNILAKSENAERGMVKARTLGVAMWLSLGGLFLVLTIISAVLHLIPGVVLYFLAATVFTLNGVRILKTVVHYTEAEICIDGPGIHLKQSVSNVVSAQTHSSRIRGSWYLLISFKNGQKIRMEQIDYQGLVMFQKVLKRKLDCKKPNIG